MITQPCHLLFKQYEFKNSMFIFSQFACNSRSVATLLVDVYADTMLRELLRKLCHNKNCMSCGITTILSATFNQSALHVTIINYWISGWLKCILIVFMQWVTGILSYLTWWFVSVYIFTSIGLFRLSFLLNSNAWPVLAPVWLSKSLG